MNKRDQFNSLKSPARHFSTPDFSPESSLQVLLSEQYDLIISKTPTLKI